MSKNLGLRKTLEYLSKLYFYEKKLQSDMWPFKLLKKLKK